MDAPTNGTAAPLLWMRERDFFRATAASGWSSATPIPARCPPRRRCKAHPDHVREVWRRGDLIGIDTGCGRSGFLSCIELPADRVYDSR